MRIWKMIMLTYNLNHEMRYLFSCFGFLLFGYACTPPGQPESFTQKQQVSVDTIQRLPCEDPKWASGDTLFRSREPSFFHWRIPGLADMGFSQKIKLKNRFLGIIVDSNEDLDGMALALFQTDTLDQWVQTYCGEIEGAMNYNTSLIDLNFDGYKDLLIDGDYGGIRGNRFFIGFLFVPQSQIFRRHKALNLENLTIDLKNKELRSRHYGSPYGSNSKSLYAWEGDSLVLIQEAVYHADVDAIIWLKEMQKDGTIKHDTITGKMDPLWEFFLEKCVWKRDFYIDSPRKRIGNLVGS